MKKVKMKNLKTFEEINESFFDSVKNRKVKDDQARLARGKTKLIEEFRNLESNHTDGSIASDSEFATFLNTPATGYAPHENGKARTKGDVIAHELGSMIHSMVKHSPQSFNITLNRKAGATTIKDEIKKLLV